MSAIYDNIGDTYSQTRRADERIVDQIVRLLDLPVGSRILDVGAGIGSYSLALANRGFNLTALEPSEVMSNQSESHERVSWVTGEAENLPFGDASFDAASARSPELESPEW